jgi:hypothetical protein
MNPWTKKSENIKTHQMIRGRRTGGLRPQNSIEFQLMTINERKKKPSSPSNPLPITQPIHY